MRKKLIHMTAACLGFSLVLGMTPGYLVQASEMEADSAVAGIAVSLNNYYATSYSPEADILALIQESIAGPMRAASDVEEFGENDGLVFVNYQLNVRQEPTTDSAVLGILNNNYKVTILEEVEGEDGTWYKITSGDVEGYIKADFVLRGEEALQKAKEFATSAVRIMTDNLNVRATADMEGEVIGKVTKGYVFEVVSASGDFYQIQLRDGSFGFVHKDYVELTKSLREAEKISDEEVADEIEGNMREAENAYIIYEEKLAAFDYVGAQMAIDFSRECYQLIIDTAEANGLDEVAEAAEVKRDEAQGFLDQVNATLAQIDANQTPEVTEQPTAAPETPAAQPQAPAPTEPAAVTLVGIRAYYTGGQKYVGDKVSGTEMRVDAVYSDDSVVSGVSGWGCAEIGMILPEGATRFYVNYQGYNAFYDVAATQRPAEPTPPPAPAQPTEPTPPPAAPSNSQLRNDLAAAARSWVGRCNYVYSGTNLVPGGGVDCSGFTYCLYRDIAKITINRTSASQPSSGRAISFEQLQPGDLVFYHGTNPGGIGHVGMYVGNGEIVHAANPAAGIKISPVKYEEPIGYCSILN